LFTLFNYLFLGLSCKLWIMMGGIANFHPIIIGHTQLHNNLFSCGCHEGGERTKIKHGAVLGWVFQKKCTRKTNVGVLSDIPKWQ
jgi:hypothetical protein